MAMSDWIYKIKDSWDRVVGGFLHGDEESYQQEPAYYSEQNDMNAYGYGQQEGENAYGYPEQSYDSRVSPYAGSYAQQMQGEEPDYEQEYYQEQPSVADNIVAFPGVTVEQVMMPQQVPALAQIIQLKDRETCKVVIEALRNNASVMINMENIASDTEKQRCVDMLGGAAYTLNCQISKVSVKGVYFISSATMQIEMDEATQRLNGLVRASGQARGENPLYRSQRPPMHRNDYTYEQPMAVGYEQSPYAAPYGNNQNDYRGVQQTAGGYGAPYAGMPWS